MYTEPLFEEDLKKEVAWKRYNDFLKNILSKKKYNRIKDFIRFPLNAVDISEATLTEINKVFEASNSFFSVETGLDNQTLIEDKIKELNLIEFIKNNGKKVLKNSPNTFVVLDRNKDGEEYFLTIGNDRLIDFDIEGDNVNYIAFIHSQYTNEADEEITLYSVYCDEYYRVFKKIKDDYILVDDMEIAHGLGSCPAKMFLEDNLSTKDCFNKRIPLTSVLSKLEEWQTFDIYKFYVDHYGPFPVIEKVKENCSVEGCVGGFIEKTETWFEDEISRSRTIYQECPSCSSKSITGPGTTITLPAKADKDDPDSSGAFRMISPDVKNLEYINKKLVALENYIELKTVGADKLMEKQAVNEKQVFGSFETKKSILLNIKPNFDNLYKWMVKMLCSSIYGSSENISVNADFGTEYFLISEDDIQERFGNAMKTGLPEAEIDTIYSQLIDTKYRTNPEMSQRMKLIKILDPCPFDDFETKLKKYEKGAIKENEFHISTKILHFIERFERENIDLITFGKVLPLREKVDRILTELNTYADEYVNTEQTGAGEESSI